MMKRQSANGHPTPQAIGMMPDDTVRTLLCLVEGDTTVFQVKAHVNNNLLDLKELVYEKGVDVARGPVLAKDLVLWKLDEPELVSPARSLAQRIRSRGNNLSRFAVEMEEPTDKVWKHFPQHPPDDVLHILVQIPSPAELSVQRNINGSRSIVSYGDEELPPLALSPKYSARLSSGSGRFFNLSSPSTPSSPESREWTFMADHMSINLGPRMWNLHAPAYGLEGTVRGTVCFIGEEKHVESVTAILEGKMTITTPQRGTTASQSDQPLLSRTITLYSSHMTTFNWHQGVSFAIAFPTEASTRMGTSKLPPSFSCWHPSVRCENSYSLRLEMSRKGFRRHESKIIPILYLPKTTPAQSPITTIPRPTGNPFETPYPICERIETHTLSADWPQRTRQQSTESTYLSLPAPLSFASGQSIPFSISLVCPGAPPLAHLLAQNIKVGLIKRTRIWVNAGRDISVRELHLTSGELGRAEQLAEGIAILEGSIQAGKAGQEGSWQVDGVSEVQYILRTSIKPPQHLEEHCPSFKRDVTIQLTTHPWTVDGEEEGISSPALGLAPCSGDPQQSHI